MPHWKFFVWTFAGSAIWNTILAGAGLVLGSNFRQLQDYVGPVALASIVAMLAWYLYRVVTWKPRD
jgi:membrane protein DedA with SNARE-associated domain